MAYEHIDQSFQKYDYIEKPFQRAMNLFARKREYSLCALSVAPHLFTSATPEMTQVFLVSLQRLGFDDLATRFGYHCLAISESQDERDYLAFTLGQREPLPESDPEDELWRCRASFYWGCRLATLGFFF
jgi:hypothetical protein